MSTERRNPHSVDVDLIPTERVLRIINAEDSSVAAAVGAAIPEIARVVDTAVHAIQSKGRVIYVGAGTSGRLAVQDSAECPPTFGTPPEWIQSMFAGGPDALVQAVEDSEDDRDRGAAELEAKSVSDVDLVIGIAASGATPYTVAAIECAKSRGAKTAALVAEAGTPLSKVADITICTLVGPEVITGSTRMKAGTAHKMVLNMISTATMIRLGMTYSNWMINVAMTNRKLRARGIQILQEILGVHADVASKLATRSGGNLKVAVVMGALDVDRKRAEALLAEKNGYLRKVVAHLGSGRE